MSWLSDFYRTHPAYRALRVARRSACSIHFELAPGLYEAHFQIRPIYSRVTRARWMPESLLADAARLVAAGIRNPIAAAQFAASLPLATVLTLPPGDRSGGEDTRLLSTAGTYNYGITSPLNVGLGGAIYLSRLLIRFDVSSIPTGATVSSAVKTLYCESETSTTDYAVSCHRALTQWYEGAKDGAAPDAGQNGSTWNLRNANGAVAWAGGAGGASGSDWVASATASTTITGVGAFNWTVTADVQAFVRGTASNFGWWEIGVEGTDGSNKRFTSSDGATEANRPQLVVTYTLSAGGAPIQQPFAAAFRGPFG